MKIPVPIALAAVVVVATCTAALVTIYGDGWLHEGEPPGEIQPAVTRLEPSVPVAPVHIIAVEKLEIDLQGQRVLIPGDGWMSAPEFWDIYYNQPQRLPGDIDFEKLQQLKELTEKSPVEDTGDLPQQPDTSGQPLDLALDPSMDLSLDPPLDPSQDPSRDPVWDPARDAALNPAWSPAPDTALKPV